MKRILYILYICLSYTFTSYSQEVNVYDLFAKSFEKAEKKGKEYFKGQILKGKRNGMGLLFRKDEYIYIGDFYRGKIKGYGLSLVSEKGFIKNCDECVAYVGNWQDGKKSGFGICYDKNGNILYQGMFEDDKPTTQYPSLNNEQSSKHFSLFRLSDGNLYLGESANENAHGYGVLLFENGDLWLSNFKNGMRNGVGLFLLYDGEWETVNFDGESYSVISSSTNYKNMDLARKEAFKQGLSVAMEHFAEAVNSGVELAYQIHKMNDSSNEEPVNGSESGTHSSSNGGNSPQESSSNRNNSSNDTNSDRNAKWMAANYQSQKAVYSNYESQLIKMNANMDSYNESQRKDIQAKMKNVRETIVSHGGTCPKSSWETWTP